MSDDRLNPGELTLENGEGDEKAEMDVNPEQGKPALTVEERLAKLAAQAADRPTFASDRKTTDQVELPNGQGWFIPRPLTRNEALKLESIQARARTWMTPGESMEKARPVDTQAKRDEYYSWLCGCGIENYELVLKTGEKRRGDYKANPSSRDTEAAFNALDPIVGEWVQLYLEVFNGLSDEQRRERGNA